MQVLFVDKVSVYVLPHFTNFKKVTASAALVDAVGLICIPTVVFASTRR